MFPSVLARPMVGALVLLCVVFPGAPSASGSSDLERACPGAAAQLRQQLAGAWPDRQEEGEVRVRLGVDRRGITQLVVHNLRGDYRDPARKAVRALTCRANSGSEERIEFNLVFLPP